MKKSSILVALFFVVGYALAMVAYSLTMEHNDQNAARRTVVADAPEAEPKTQNAGGGDAEPAPRPPDNPDQVISAVNVASSDIYLLNSAKAHDYATSSGKDYDQLMGAWRDYFDARDLQYIEIQDGNLTSDLTPGVLILPSAVALSSEQRAAIVAFEKKGGSVLATWATGAKDGAGQWKGYEFLREQFGIRVNGEITPQDKEEFLVVAGETPVASTLPSGSRMWLGLGEIHEHPLRISGGDNIAGRFMDWDRTPSFAKANEAIVYTEAGPSRRVYFGFPESVWQFDQDNIYIMIDDVLNWLRRRPHAYLANWPYPYRAAEIVEMDTEQGFPNAVNFADLLDKNGFQGTFYCLTSVARLYPEVIERLEKQKHEIAYHADVHDAFKGQPKDTQSKRLDTMRKQLQPLVADASKLRGFRPPYELEDNVTETLLFEKGFGHILANQDNTEAMLPYLSLGSPKDFDKGLIVLPRTQLDDMNFKDEALGVSEMAKDMDREFDLARELGALGILSVHSQNFDSDSPLAKAVAEFVAHVKASGNKTWVAPSGTIEAWWRNRAQLKAHLIGDSTRMVLDVTVQKPGLHWSTALVVSNPVKGKKPTINGAKSGMALPRLVALDDYQTAIVFGALEPGRYSYELNF